jgi:hypothetical protein
VRLGFCSQDDFGLLRRKRKLDRFGSFDRQRETRWSFMESEKIDESRVVVRMRRFDFQFGMSIGFVIFDEMRVDSRYMTAMLDFFVRMKERGGKQRNKHCGDADHCRCCALNVHPDIIRDPLTKPL